MRKTIVISLSLLLIGAAAAAILRSYQNGRQEEAAPPPKPVTVAVSSGDVAQTVTAPGQLAGTQERVLGVDLAGRLVELNVRPGSIIRAGDVIARLDPQPYERALKIAETELMQAEAEHQRQVAAAELAVAAGEAQVESTQAQVPSLSTAEINLQAAKEQEARAAYEYQKAEDREWEPPEIVEAYRLEWENMVRGVELAEAEYDRVLADQWSVSQQASALSKNVEQSSLEAHFLAQTGVDPLLELAVEDARGNLEQTTITAPFDGVVLEVFARAGEQLPAGANLVLVTDPAQGEVRTTVIEEDLSFVRLGQTAEIYFDARPDVLVNAQVARIVPQRVSGEARPLYDVYLSLFDPLPQGVFPGMTADASLLIEKVEDTLRLPRALVAARSDGTATVEIWANDRVISREITVGLRGDVYVAVLDGLEAGDEIVGE